MVFVTSKTYEPHRTDPSEPTGLLPVLEVGPTKVSDDALAALPIPQLLKLALSSDSDYWSSLAVEWIGQTGIRGDIRDALVECAHGRRGTQKSRHAARRILRDSE
jgi:hypothetical protein